jgi:autotransporter translocation and assembly factor TamB
METVPFLVRLPDESEEVKGIFSANTEIAVRDLPIEKLRKNLDEVVGSVAVMLGDIRNVGSFRLKEVTMQVEVNAEGGIELVGTAKLGGKAAITLTFSE